MIKENFKENFQIELPSMFNSYFDKKTLELGHQAKQNHQWQMIKKVRHRQINHTIKKQ